MNRDNIWALIAVRSGSKRVPNKNKRAFANSSLLEVKINKIKKVEGIEKIIVSSDDKEMLETSKRLGATVIERDPHYASDEVPMSDVYVHMAQNLSCQNIAYLNVTSPMLSTQTLQKIVDKYRNLPSGFDSLATVDHVKEYLWKDGKAINYDPKNHPRSQDLPEIFALNFAACILPREIMIKNRNVVGYNFFKYVTPPEESIDIDTMLDFKIAEFLYREKYCIQEK